MAVYTYVHAYATLNEAQLVNECVAAGLPVIDVQREGDVAETIDVITSATLTGPQVTTLTATVAAHNAAPPPTNPPNLLMNGGFWFDTRSRSMVSIADDTYGFDRWYLLTQTGTSYFNSGTADRSVRLRTAQQQATAQRLGVAQIVESANSKLLWTKTASFQFLARASAAMNLRYAILGWVTTADVVTSDVVSNWASTTYTAGNFFPATNISIPALGVTALTTGDQSIVVEGVIGNDTNNVIVLVWSESAMAQNAWFEISEAGLYAGTGYRAWAPADIGTELARCQRYCLKLTSQALGVAQNTNNMFNIGAIIFPTTMLKTPALLSGGTFTVNSGSAGTPGLSSASNLGTGFTNTANNWTANALVSAGTLILDAEL